MRWLLIGQDLRIAECARLLRKVYRQVTLFEGDCVTEELLAVTKQVNPTHVVLPIQGIQGSLPAAGFPACTQFFTGLIEAAQQTMLESAGHQVVSYLQDERFVWNNARLTAEGFVKEFYSEASEPIANTRFQIAGYGRVGRMTAHVLDAMGADIHIYARSETQLGEAEALGFDVTKLSEETEIESGYLVNTIPVPWLSLQSESTIRVYDLASKPGCLKQGTSTAYYTEHLGLPGKHFPQEAASYLADTILRMCSGKE